MAYKQQGYRGRGRVGWGGNNPLYHPKSSQTHQAHCCLPRSFVISGPSQAFNCFIEQLPKDTYSYRLSSGQQSAPDEYQIGYSDQSSDFRVRNYHSRPPTGRGSRTMQTQSGATQLPVPKQYSPRRKVSNLQENRESLQDFDDSNSSPSSGCRHNNSQEELTHPFSDKECRGKSSVHIGGLLTLPKPKSAEVNKDSTHRSLSEVIAQGCKDIDKLVTNYNIKSVDVDLLAFSKTVQNFVRNTSNVIHVEPIMREMMLAFMHISSSWVALSSVLDLPREQTQPLDGIAELGRVFIPWQEKSKEMLDAIRVALHHLPEECEKYFSPSASQSITESSNLNEASRPKNGKRNSSSRNRQMPRYRKPHQNRRKTPASSNDAEDDLYQKEIKISQRPAYSQCPYDADDTSMSDSDSGSDCQPKLDGINAISPTSDQFDEKDCARSGDLNRIPTAEYDFRLTRCALLEKIWNIIPNTVGETLTHHEPIDRNELKALRQNLYDHCLIHRNSSERLGCDLKINYNECWHLLDADMFLCPKTAYCNEFIGFYGELGTFMVEIDEKIKIKLLDIMKSILDVELSEVTSEMSETNAQFVNEYLIKPMMTIRSWCQSNYYQRLCTLLEDIQNLFAKARLLHRGDFSILKTTNQLELMLINRISKELGIF